MKLELRESKHCLLKTEAAVYRMLKGEHGFPLLHWFGSEGDYNVMVLDLLGPSLDCLQEMCGGRFSVSTTFALGQQMVRSSYSA